MRLKQIEHLENHKMHIAHTWKTAYTFFLHFTTDLQRKPNWTDHSFQNWNRTEPAVFLETAPNLKNLFCTSLLVTD